MAAERRFASFEFQNHEGRRLQSCALPRVCPQENARGFAHTIWPAVGLNQGGDALAGDTISAGTIVIKTAA
jgi:hypothetical protein